jgi:phosphohistidine phosphatase SixA
MRRVLGIAVIVCLEVFGFLAYALAQTATQVVEPDRAALLAVLREGGSVLLLRHAQTVPGVGDPPGFVLSDCKTQRNLSPEGIEQAKRIGVAARTEFIRFAKVLTSQWCRCRDTAQLISSEVSDWPALNSFFDDASTRVTQTEAVKKRLLSMPYRETWLLVTHQVNITALTGISPAMGEGVVVRVTKGELRVLGRLTL